MKFTNDRPFADPDKAARRQKQHAHAFEPVQDGRIYIEKLNGPFLFGDKGTPAEYAAGLDRAISLGWLEIHEPALRFFMARPTFFEAPLEYFLFFAFLAIATGPSTFLEHPNRNSAFGQRFIFLGEMQRNSRSWDDY